MLQKKYIYLDHSATTAVDTKVLQIMLPYFHHKFGNASSAHTFGQEALMAVDKTRKQAAHFLNCSNQEIIFTSGSTESNNLAIKGLVSALQNKKMHIITSSVEHDSVLEPFRELEKNNIETTYLPVQSDGTVKIDELKKAIKSNTILVSIMYVNSEVGIIQPITEISKIIKKIKKNQKIYFHTDATQAINFLNCDVKYLGVDFLSLSGHKIYGPKGVGLLYKKQNAPILSLQQGGHQENNLRSGTFNVSGIAGLGAAINQLNKKVVQQNNKKISKLRDMLVDGIIKNIPNVILNTNRKNSTPSHAHFSFLGVEGESILMALDLQDVYVSTGSACASKNLKASHVLFAMGIKQEIAHNSIRFTLGKHTTIAEIKQVIKILPPIIKQLRKISPYKIN
ncbi:cysteine desulfurase [Patescibacteria group bacterium]|nr:cysteine desulfurase [Patescibacteria group bacterium]